MGFHTAELLGHHQTLKLKIHTLSAVPNYLFSISAAIINAWRLSSLYATWALGDIFPCGHVINNTLIMEINIITFLNFEISIMFIFINLTS